MIYKDKAGHWTSKENNGGECEHKSFKYPMNDKKQKEAYDMMRMQGYELREIPLDALLNDDSGLDNANDIGSYHDETWGKDPSKFDFDENRINDWGNANMYVKKKDGRYKIGDGRHRIRALVNKGYDSVEVPFKNFDIEKAIAKGLGVKVDDDKDKM